jgi:carbonic anhydrase
MKRLTLSSTFLAGLAALALALGGCSNERSQTAAEQPRHPGPTVSPTTKDAQQAMTPSQALEQLKAGNRRFVSKQPLHRNPLADARSTASGQYPFAVVLSCIDSRQPIELVLDQGIGDIFSARVAGSVLNADILGCMEFACKVSGSKLIAVISHTSCGAIKGTVDNVELGNLTDLLAKVKPAMDGVPAEIQPRTSKNSEYVDKVAEASVRLVLRQIRERSPVLREMLDQGQIEVVGGLYDVSTGEIHFFERYSAK